MKYSCTTCWCHVERVGGGVTWAESGDDEDLDLFHLPVVMMMISSMMLITDNNENSSQTFSHPTINALRWPWMRMKWRWCKFGWRFLESGDLNWKVIGVVIIMSKCKITISWNQTQVCEMNQIPLLCILIRCGLALCAIFSRLCTVVYLSLGISRAAATLWASAGQNQFLDHLATDPSFSSCAWHL